jgi:hypothetical protein
VSFMMMLGSCALLLATAGVTHAPHHATYLCVHAAVDEASLALPLHKVVARVLREPPVAAGHHLLAPRELELGAAQGLGSLHGVCAGGGRGEAASVGMRSGAPRAVC